MTRQSIAIGLLVTGALTGVVLAAVGLVTPPGGLADNDAARVNDNAISRDQLAHYVVTINENSRTAKDTHYILQRMIDEELLVQRGLELGFLAEDNTVRNAMVQAVTKPFATGDSDAAPTDDELSAFYEANRDYFTPPSQYRVTMIAPRDYPLPDKPLTERSLREYLGPAATEQIKALAPGTSVRYTTTDGEFEIRLDARVIGEAPAFASVRPMIEREYQRRNNERAFAAYVSWLRERADIELAPDLQ